MYKRQRGYVLTSAQEEMIRKNILDTVAEGNKVKIEKVEEKQDTSSLLVLNPQQRLRLKVLSTIINDIQEVEERWGAGESKIEFDAYTRMKTHELPSMACSFAIPWVAGLHDQYYDALNKKCDQAVEAYKHLSKKQLTERTKLLNKILDDLKRYHCLLYTSPSPRDRS